MTKHSRVKYLVAEGISAPHVCDCGCQCISICATTKDGRHHVSITLDRAQWAEVMAAISACGPTEAQQLHS